MFRLGHNRLVNSGLRFQSTLGTVSAEKFLPNAVIQESKFVLATVRSFPSLEPVSFVPVSSTHLNAPIRRDILWQAVVYENDRRRVGASNPPGRSENGYSRRKLHKQKGTGRARVGDANSPTRHNGGQALARTAPNNYVTDLPAKLYSKAFINALSHQYQSGNLIVIGNKDYRSSTLEEVLEDSSCPTDLNQIELLPSTETGEGADLVFDKFLNEHNLGKKRLLFITSFPKFDFMENTQKHSEKVDVIPKELIEVNDILKAQKIFIDLEALSYLCVMHGTD
ncbi:hypothetical protein Kpol_1004p49 [Vanderwaltozyma polyspora DSM 70294]|uniref:Large ribosomal subunit protein uL4m n=1 Tax=Vanderwaltozyma polyspora (strain ATCC 22028 / DSM 70294 / BCRC 21397 / CBS 2163 / NBRC 10782 / NRRL Y-8283 / UCD 57-17) TaxID=436907 RepID=A7TJA5_VANPO|nr:uncharacterized protein Kpol_1004p49 [Vanderwaltozyma polyspora DSM 70294]EDO17674.1 hypothetical protein Kpol_1004p49 [Vanderwaltozyma polyspora DSM 70294]